MMLCRGHTPDRASSMKSARDRLSQCSMKNSPQDSMLEHADIVELDRPLVKRLEKDRVASKLRWDGFTYTYVRRMFCRAGLG
jgi:chemotaxis regulatin CheY-phosphate phosphatase CheZ